MKIPNSENATLDDLLKLYADAAAAHSEAANHRITNKHHDIVAAVYRELRTRGVESQRALLRLLNHPNIAVRGWAAAHSLEFAPEDGKPVLKSIADGTGIWSLTAQATLDEWENGALRFP